MKIILEESQRLSAAREGLRLTRNGSNERADGDISLTDLPDLTEDVRAPGFIKRVSSRDSGAVLLGSKPSKTCSNARSPNDHLTRKSNYSNSLERSHLGQEVYQQEVLRFNRRILSRNRR